MKKINYLVLIVAIAGFSSFVQSGSKLVSTNGHINFFSHTDAEDITADNYKVTSTMDTATGDVVYSVPMQSFEFKKALMQKHFNSENYLNTKVYPKAKFKGTITNLNTIHFNKDGSYPATVKGDLTIKDITNPVTEQGTITVTKGKIHIDRKMTILLSDYKINFTEGKPSTNIAKTVDLTIYSDY